MIAKIFYTLGKHIESSIPGITRFVGLPRDLHSYPSFTIHRPDTASYQSNIRHISDGSKLYIVRCSLRGYTYTSVETSIDDSETLARQIEVAVQSFARAVAIITLEEEGILSTQESDELSTQDLFNILIQRELSYLDDARVVSLETDEGLFAPAGICDVEIEMLYVETR
jgi:hypothetical protein